MANNEVATKIKEEEVVKETEQEKIMRAERLASKEAELHSVIKEEDLPPTIMKDKYGNEMSHILIEGKYMAKPLADVFIQEKKVVTEYNKLELLKAEAKHYKKVSEKSKK